MAYSGDQITFSKQWSAVSGGNEVAYPSSAYSDCIWYDSATGGFGPWPVTTSVWTNGVYQLGTNQTARLFGLYWDTTGKTTSLLPVRFNAHLNNAQPVAASIVSSGAGAASSYVGYYPQAPVGVDMFTPATEKAQHQLWGEWHHFGAIYTNPSGTTIRTQTFLDGKPTGDATKDIGNTVGAWESLTVGGSPWAGVPNDTHRWMGVSDLCIWDDELTPGEMMAIGQGAPPLAYRDENIWLYHPMRYWGQSPTIYGGGTGTWGTGNPANVAGPTIRQRINFMPGPPSTQTAVTTSPAIDLAITDPTLTLGTATAATSSPVVDVVIADPTASVGAVTATTASPVIDVTITDPTMTTGAITASTSSPVIDLQIGEVSAMAGGTVIAATTSPTIDWEINSVTAALGAIAPPSECLLGQWLDTVDLAGTWETTIDLSGDWTNC